LMSYCESFGIPAAEAMAFGTPIVASQDCAISEVCAGAGLFGPAGNPDWTADALEQLLTDPSTWSQFSSQALQNASRLRWEACSRPLMKMFEIGH
jgi:glycosyltransferase involved in cell wall biosynthesis